MVYSDLVKFGLVGVLPEPKAKNGCYARQNKKIKNIACNMILKNRDFCQFAMKEKQAKYINDILALLVAFVIKANETYYYYKNIVDNVKI